MKKALALLLFLAGTVAFAQSVNDYKYVIVPAKFDFLKNPNQYNMNALTKSLLEKYGFVVFYDTENLPAEVSDYNCNKLYADVTSNGGFMKTKIQVKLKDCKGNVLFATQEGQSREKEYQISYTMALRDTSKSFDELQYKYNGSGISVERSTIKTTNDGTTIKQEIIPTKATAVADTSGKETFFAQPVPNGYQLVDSTPKVVMKIYNTSTKDTFIAEKGELRGLLKNDNGNWIFEYYLDGKPMSEILNIKF